MTAGTLPADEADPTSALVRLLDDGARFGPEYGDGLSSHLPMALQALHGLGADALRLQDFAAAYAQRLHLPPAPAADPWPAGDAWPARLGQCDAYAAYLDLFKTWIDQEGAADTLAQVLPPLMPGCGAVAFHGLIRVASALRARHAGELAAGLAYWASRHMPLGPLVPVGPLATSGRQAGPAAAPTTRAELLLRGLPVVRSRLPLIAQRMQAAAAHPAAAAATAALRITPGTLAQLARLAAQAHAATGNFTALHLVTATHAMRVVLGFIDDQPAALRWFWQAWVAAVMAAGLVPRPPVPLRAWAQIVPVALASDDEHLIKLVDSCRCEEATHGGTAWRASASRAVADAAAVAAA